MNPLPSRSPSTKITATGSFHVDRNPSIPQPPRSSSVSQPSSTTLPFRDPEEPLEDPPRICDDCEDKEGPIWDCSNCGMNFCDHCWKRQGPHKPGRTGPDGLPHEKGDPNIVKRLKEILSPTTNEGIQRQLHAEDEDTTWFGISRDHLNRPVLADYGRYATIMADSNAGTFKDRYPWLVSFIGQTGAGKSTLVKMLIDQQERKNPRNFPSPVVGSLHTDNVPTSGDVHLYSDPSTYYDQTPLIYADCEGMEGGEKPPLSAQYMNSKGKPKEKTRRPSYTDSRMRNKIHKVARGTSRNLKWAADSPEKSKRQYAVTELYPRLLYTFSDVIVFVLRNPKTFESSVLSKLVGWASSSLEKSLNQPTLPHAVIALNATDMGVDEQEWDPEFATKTLINSVAGAVKRYPEYRALAEYWRTRGKRINDTNDLLRCYYSSITVVRIPVKGRYMKIDEQVKKLHDVLEERCYESFRAKLVSRMLSTAEELNIYLQCAFDHFSQDLNAPFNFMDVAFRINPIPSDFGGNILKLAIAIKGSNRFHDPRMMFRELSSMVASCILLDCARQGLKGSTEQIFQKAYINFCDMALTDFCSFFWPCSFSNKRGRCVNVKDRHKKGHQNEKGHIIDTGEYTSDFTWDTFADEWFSLLQSHLVNYQNFVQNQNGFGRTFSEVSATTAHHLTTVNNFYQRLDGARRFVSHSSCFCCLRELAEHPLPCGHVICTPCVKGYGKPRDRDPDTHVLTSCPLHHRDVFEAPREIRFKPPLAGVRILSMDGGGIRGIVILEILSAIEKEFDHRIPIQDFFDLVVGTSTGGIIALALGVKGWSIEECMSLFRKFVDKAFTPKLLGGPKLGKNKYNTQPLEEALKEVFREEPIFGGTCETAGTYTRKVAVTSSSETADRAVIFTNYNRANDSTVNYRLERPDDQRNELKLWEAARATSAAPTFFKPFVNSRTNEGYIDGAVFHNNPVRIANREGRLIWPDIGECPPDLLLSVGTGRSETDSEGFADIFREFRRTYSNINMSGKAPTEQRRNPVNYPTLWAQRAFPKVNAWLNIILRRVDNVLDSEATWQDFRNEVVGISSHMHAERYMRINPRVLEIPKMDDKSKVEDLSSIIRRQLGPKGPENMRQQVVQVAHRLVASCFYFERWGPARESGDHFDTHIHGRIRCRFADDSGNLRGLGSYMKGHQLHSFRPFFKVQGTAEQAIYIDLTHEIIKNMTDEGYFSVESIAIPVSRDANLVSIDLHLTNEDSSGYPISGFPRNLADSKPVRRASSPMASEIDLSSLAQRLEAVRRKRTDTTSSTDSSELSKSVSNGSGYNYSLEGLGDWFRRLKAGHAPTKPVENVDPELALGTEKSALPELR